MDAADPLTNENANQPVASLTPAELDLSPIDDDPHLPIIDLHRLAYAPALAVQRLIHAQVVAGDRPPTVLLVEHDPVITISRRKNASLHMLASQALLESMGIDVLETDRGGDVTYHGPGQLVVYPIIRFSPLNLNVSRYMRLLEQIIIDAIAPLGIAGVRDACATGVWVHMNEKARFTGEKGSDSSCAAGPNDPQATAKVAALGVRLSRNVSLHGLALNVSTDLSHFATIVPCGLLNRPVTSLSQLLSGNPPSMVEVKREMIRSLRQHLVTGG